MGKKTTVESPKEQLAKKRKRQRRGQNTIYYGIFAVLCVAVGIVMSFTVFFRIDMIKVTPNNIYNDEEIINASGITRGDNLFQLRASQIIETLYQRFPYIESASLKRMLPSILEISLEMAEPFAAIDIGDTNLIVNKEGRVLDCINGNTLDYRRAEGFETEPFDSNPDSWYRHYTCLGGIEHYGLQDMEKGDLDNGVCKAGYRHTGAVSRKQLSPNNLEKLDILIELEAIFQKYEMEKITAVELSDPNNLYLLYDNRLLISVGNINELDYKLQFADHVIDNSVEEGYTGLLDITVPKYARLRGVNIYTDAYWKFSDELRVQIIGNIMPPSTEDESTELPVTEPSEEPPVPAENPQ